LERARAKLCSIKMTLPEDFPRIIEYSSYNGNFPEFWRNVSEVYKRDFIDSYPRFRGKTVFVDRRIKEEEPEGLWHVCSETNQKTKERETDIRRCERVPWLRAIIEKADSIDEILVWEQKRKRKLRWALTTVLVHIF
jgi:hypothetical protein